MSIDYILEKALAGERVSVAEGVRLFEEADLFDLGAVANELNLKKNPRPRKGERPLRG